MLQHLVQTL